MPIGTSFPLSYCPDGYDRLARLRRLYEDRAQDIVLATMRVPSETIAAMAQTCRAGLCEYPDPRERARFWDALLRERAAIRDDSIPSAYLSEMDQGLYGGLVGGKVEFMFDPDTGWISSMVAPILNDWSEFDRLAVAPRHAWFQRYLDQLRIFVEAAEGKFGVSHFILINGINFVFELFGATQTYMDMIERPDDVRRAMDFAFKLNETVQRAFFDAAPLLAGGTCSNMLQWAPGRIVSESIDPFHMTSVEYFEQWGRGTLERIFARFDGGGIHIHGNGRRLLAAASAVKGLKGIYLGDDRGAPQAFDILDEVRSRVGDVPLVATVGLAKFESALRAHRLTGGVLYNVAGVPDADAANRLMDRVRAYRN